VISIYRRTHPLLFSRRDAQFWRSFAECQISLVIHAGSRERAAMVESALLGMISTARQIVLDSEHSLPISIITLPSFVMPSLDSTSSAPREPAIELKARSEDKVIRVVSQPAASKGGDGTVRLVLVASMSRYFDGERE
jgi:hypothetical protein